MLSRVMGLSLTRINLSCCSAVSQEGFHLLALANPALAVVGLASCRRVFAGLRETTLDICRSLGHLTSLDLSYNRISSLSRNLQLFNFHAVKYLGRSTISVGQLSR